MRREAVQLPRCVLRSFVEVALVGKPHEATLAVRPCSLRIADVAGIPESFTAEFRVGGLQVELDGVLAEVGPFRPELGTWEVRPSHGYSTGKLWRSSGSCSQRTTLIVRRYGGSCKLQ
eukprot:gnl/TRDRNA2_/TRDRNA2_30194_c0_seq1.p2 gnl/TRDRNA2_/TRDRNA2_30194_c0~~gnl/TRDRNA2_/TRDRNA2_30194_c0_seq1.p2  ORF type:complete len:118 (-),score=20.20 gnl/TRDRNA2_/TRDRNA2_30194_c0_seq1:276-629(-)